MAILISSFFIPTKFVSEHLTFPKKLVRPQMISRSCRAMCGITETQKLENQTPIIRRSANYQSTLNEFSHTQSISNPYAGEIYVKHRDELKEIVKQMLAGDSNKEPLHLLELIDDLQRLGLSYHFETQIKEILINIYNNTITEFKEDDLYAKALMFRLFRQHGFNVSQEIFECFKDEKGNYKMSLCKDKKGMLYLYEASYLLGEGEHTLELAREFTKKHLKKSVEDLNIDHNLSALVHHALKVPLHWRSLRVEARWFIDIYEARADMNPLVLQLAKLDFNILQSIHHEDLKDATRWWKNIKVVEKLTFARDNMVQCFFWNVGIIGGEPQYGYARRMGTKVIEIITILDDTYDVYGTLDELQLLTDAIERWDINAIDHLPYSLKVSFLVLFNFANERAYDSLIEHGIHTFPYIRKMWSDMFKAQLVEAKWFYNGYKPTFEEYINNSVISSGGPLILFHTYLAADNPINREALETICNYPDIVRFPSMLLRLANDLETSSEEIKRGDVTKSVQCHMNETSVSEEQAREYIKFLISEAWKRINKDRAANNLLSETFIEMAMNLGRTSQCVYEFGDGHCSTEPVTRERIMTLLFEPIPVEYMKF